LSGDDNSDIIGYKARHNTPLIDLARINHYDALEYWETPKVLCATASRDSSEAMELAIALGEAVVAAGFSPDIKPFRAHLTLARKIAAAQAASVPLPLPLEPPMVMRADKFVLMSSRREGERSIYSAVETWPLYA